MIPKILYFNWFGETQPDYINFSINTFKKVNPDFEIVFTRIIDPFNDKNEDVLHTIDLMNTPNNFLYNFSNKKWVIDNLTKTKNGLLCRFSNAFRCYMLNKYGGIYLDCDTFPIKPFDNELLTNNNFSAFFYGHKDCFFLGSKKDMFSYPSSKEYTINPCNSIERDLFFDCKLEYIPNIKSNCYIKHFVSREWKK